MKKLFLDINVIIDIFLEQSPSFISSAAIFQKIEERAYRGGISAASYPIIFYILSKHLSKAKAIQVLSKIRTILKVSPVNK